MHVSGCLGCLGILRTLLTSLPLWLAVQPTWNLSHLSSFNHLELLKASLIVYCPDTCYQLETFNSPCLLLSAVHSLPVLTCIQQYWMLLPPPTSDVNPPPQFLCSVSWGTFPLSLKMEQQCFLRPLPFPQCFLGMVLVLPIEKSSTVNNLHFMHRKSLLATGWGKEKKKKEHLLQVTNIIPSPAILKIKYRNRHRKENVPLPVQMS